MKQVNAVYCSLTVLGAFLFLRIKIYELIFFARKPETTAICGLPPTKDFLEHSLQFDKTMSQLLLKTSYRLPKVLPVAKTNNGRGFEDFQTISGLSHYKPKKLTSNDKENDKQKLTKKWRFAGLICDQLKRLRIHDNVGKGNAKTLSDLS